MNFFIADLHLGHKNCLSFDNRPFLNIEEQDEKIISNWNNVVSPFDDVYILGDISWYDATKTLEIFKKLNGIKHLIIGNHDDKLLRNRDIQNLFVEIKHYKELYINNNLSIVLCHYPIPAFKNHYYGWVHLYGHVHVGWENNMMEKVKSEMRALYNQKCRMFNVGCMIKGIDYMPRTLEYILDTFEKDTLIESGHS